MNEATRISILGLLISGLAACGGGGGGGGTTPGTISTSFAALALTSSNAADVSGEVASAGSDTVGAGDVATDIITGVVVDTDGRPSLAEVSRWSLEAAYGLRDRLAASVTGVVVDEVINCTSGSISVSWNDADNNNELSSGDSFTIAFNSCVEMGVTISGSLAFTGFTFSGDPDLIAAWSMGATFAYTALTISDGVESLRIDGDMAFAIVTPDGINFDVDISGTGLAYRAGGYTTTLRNFVFSYAENSDTTFSLEYAGILDMGSLSGRVSFNTIVPFTGTDILGSWPTAGELLITGANNSSITLEALGGDSVQLSIDANGDGGVDQTIPTTWTALSAT